MISLCGRMPTAHTKFRVWPTSRQPAAAPWSGLRLTFWVCLWVSARLHGSAKCKIVIVSLTTN